MGYLCDNIGLVLVCLPSGSTDVTTSPSRSHAESLSCLLYFLCMLAIPIFPFLKFEEFTCTYKEIHVHVIYSTLAKVIATRTVYKTQTYVTHLHITKSNPILAGSEVTTLKHHYTCTCIWMHIFNCNICHYDCPIYTYQQKCCSMEVSVGRCPLKVSNNTL